MGRGSKELNGSEGLGYSGAGLYWIVIIASSNEIFFFVQKMFG